MLISCVGDVVIHKHAQIHADGCGYPAALLSRAVTGPSQSEQQQQSPTQSQADISDRYLSSLCLGRGSDSGNGSGGGIIWLQCEGDIHIDDHSRISCNGEQDGGEGGCLLIECTGRMQISKRAHIQCIGGGNGGANGRIRISRRISDTNTNNNNHNNNNENHQVHYNMDEMESIAKVTEPQPYLGLKQTKHKLSTKH